MPLIDPRHCWLTLVETPDGAQAAALSPAETFDFDAAAALRDRIGEAAVISFIGDNAIAYCESAHDLQICLAEWVEIDLSNAVIEVTPMFSQEQIDSDALTCAAVLATLNEVRAALDDAFSVVDAGEDETFAYEHELRRLDTLIQCLTDGAIIAE